MEAEVAGLYNEEKTDIREPKNETVWEELAEKIENLKTKEFSSAGADRIANVENDFLTAKEMADLQSEVLELFVEEGVVDSRTTTKQLSDLEDSLEIYQEKTIYHERNLGLLAEAEQQLVEIEEVEELLTSLFDGDELEETVTREQEEELIGRIREIKNSQVRSAFLTQMEEVGLTLTLREEEAALLEEALAEEETETNWADESEEETGSSWTPPPTQNAGGNTGGESTQTGGQAGNGSDEPSGESSPSDQTGDETGNEDSGEGGSGDDSEIEPEPAEPIEPDPNELDEPDPIEEGTDAQQGDSDTEESE